MSQSRDKSTTKNSWGKVLKQIFYFCLHLHRSKMFLFPTLLGWTNACWFLVCKQLILCCFPPSWWRHFVDVSAAEYYFLAQHRRKSVILLYTSSKILKCRNTVGSMQTVNITKRFILFVLKSFKSSMFSLSNTFWLLVPRILYFCLRLH